MELIENIFNGNRQYMWVDACVEHMWEMWWWWCDLPAAIFIFISSIEMYRLQPFAWGSLWTLDDTFIMLF